MANKFKVGDVVIVVAECKYKGLETVVIKEKETWWFLDEVGGSMEAYLTDIAEKNGKVAFEEDDLKLKTFDGEQKVFDMFESLNVTKEKVKELI